VIVPVRLTPVVFGYTVYEKLGEADVANDFDTEIHSSLDLIDQPHPGVAVAFITNVVPDAAMPTLKAAGVTDPGMTFASTVYGLIIDRVVLDGVPASRPVQDVKQ
jgi:hypothetical protein